MHLTGIDDAAWASPWRRRHVGEKVALSLGLVLTALVGPVWPTSVLVALVSIVAITVCARIPARTLALIMAAPLAFTAIGAVSVVIAIGAPPEAHTWWRWWVFSIGPDSLPTLARLCGHAIAGALAVLVLATTTPLVDLLTYARRWHVPDALLEVASLTYRLLFVLLSMTLALHDAQIARLGDARRGIAGLRGRITAAGDAVGSILVRSWARAQRMEDGLAGRGYESALVTLPREHPASVTFRIEIAATLALIWGLVACSKVLI